ncbi:MAG: sn-glycerol-3-phosphate ABC transporter ATP-binding protein UgpC [Rhodobacteraceae bacterium]|nr:sn-glycerol-3-phosphate ABC transporter ATP-binding protein UgpC [Paracoccaceae bacterium]
MASIELKDLHKSYGAVEVIKGIDLSVGHGEFCVFVGPSGCGKSTLLRMISGLESVTSGDIEIGGDIVTRVPAADRGLAMVFQSYALYPHMTVRQNLSFGLENINTPKAEVNAKVSEVAAMLQIDQLLDRRPKDLSGGQRQRVAIGRAVVREPRVFLFDEPLSNLDAELRVDMRGEISALHKRLGNTMVYVTHDQVEAMTMADKIAVLRLGELEQFGRPLDLFNNPRNLFVAGFIGSPKMNFMTGTVHGADRSLLNLDTGEEVSLPVKGFSHHAGDKVTLGVRPYDLRPHASGSIHIQVGAVEQLGTDSYLYGALADGTRLTVHNPGQTRVCAGDNVAMHFAPEAVHLFDTKSGLTLRGFDTEDDLTLHKPS